MHKFIVFILISIALTHTGTLAEICEQTCNNSQKEKFHQFSKSISRFAFDFYKKCSEQSDNNIVVSPFSVASVLALLIQGADGNTFKQLQSVLHLHGDKETIANQFEEYFRSFGFGSEIPENQTSATMSMASRLYLQKGYQVKPSFKDVINRKLSCDIESLNFTESDSSARSINDFIARQTKNKITKLFTDEAFDKNTRLVAVNAIYFKDEWKTKFYKENTFQDNFFVNRTKTVRTDFMIADDHFRFAYLTDLDATAIELKYKNSGLVFVIVLPNSPTGLPSLESNLAHFELSQVADRFIWQRKTIIIPKFNIDFVLTKMGDVLRKLGMTDVFSNKANFGSLLDSTEPLQLSHVIHKAIIEINEDGAEAVAVTGGEMVIGSAVTDEIDLPYKVDYPFFYYIMDPQTNTIIFSGRYIDPTLEPSIF